MTAYYNEIDPLKAETIREAIRAGAIAPGDVDERSIADVQPTDLVGYTQCHFFAGGGFWSLALRWAGWPDDRPVWTGSCPCPSFSAAGKGRGFADPRHLWPHWARLIAECRPATVFGEQVAAAIGHGWLDLVQTDLEAQDYAVGKSVLGACSVGAPHIRQRLYFCADTQHTERRPEREAERDAHGRDGLGRLRDAGSGADASSIGRQSEPPINGVDGTGTGAGRSQQEFSGGCDIGVDLDALSARLEGHFGDVREWRGPGWLDPQRARSVAEAGATRGFWADCDWWYGKDGKYRPIRPGLQPLAHGSPARVGRLRLYGDAICVPAAAEFIRAYREVRR